MTFGEKLQQLRKQNGLSQEQLASNLKVSRQAVSKWELDSSLPDTANVIQISKLFSVSTDYLLKDDIEGDTKCSNDISGVKIEAPTHKNSQPGTIRVAMGVVCTGIGGLGTIILLILSTMIEVPVMKKRILPNGRTEYYGGGDVLGYSFMGFIEAYRLQALLVVLILLVMIGIAVLVTARMKRVGNPEKLNLQTKRHRK